VDFFIILKDCPIIFLSEMFKNITVITT
jgi:hypothetical protein